MGAGGRPPRISRREKRSSQWVLRNPGITRLGLNQPCLSQRQSDPHLATHCFRDSQIPQIAKLEGPLGSLWVRKETITATSQSQAAESNRKRGRGCSKGPCRQFLLLYHSGQPGRAKPETEHIDRHASSAFPQPSPREAGTGKLGPWSALEPLTHIVNGEFKQ